MTGLVRNRFKQTAKRRVLEMWLATTLVALTLPAAMAQTPAGTQTAAITDSPAYKRGRLLYIQCRACHDLKPSPVEKVGPNLAGLFGRASATAPDFAYSPALRNAKITWDRKTLDTWIEKPGNMVPGNIMAFAGIANAADRAALISYIEVESANP
jgi:cytochrome c